MVRNDAIALTARFGPLRSGRRASELSECEKEGIGVSSNVIPPKITVGGLSPPRAFADEGRSVIVRSARCGRDTGPFVLSGTANVSQGPKPRAAMLSLLAFLAVISLDGVRGSQVPVTEG